MLFNDNGAKMQAMQDMVNVGNALGNGVPMPPREVNLTERVMQHDQRLQRLEQENQELRTALELLHNRLVFAPFLF